jgi:hypothetical protein
MCVLAEQISSKKGSTADGQSPLSSRNQHCGSDEREL